MNEKTVLTICPQPLLRVGLRQVLGGDAGLTICGEAASAAEALRMETKLRPSLVMLAVGCALGDGLSLIKDLHRSRSGLPILVIGSSGDHQHVQRAFRAGARGYVTAGDDLTELLLAVASVRSGGLYVSRGASAGLLVSLTSRQGTDAQNDLETLSDREMEIFRMIGQGMGCKDIAGQLHISVKTVETHRQRMKDKLHLHTGSELNHHAARNAIQTGGRKATAAR